MKTYRTETIVVTTSGHRLELKGHITGVEIIDAIKSRFTGLKDSHGVEVTLTGRAAHLEVDGYDSIKNFSFNDYGMEFDTWTA